ncbi:hypothetical protein BDN70DRAFT_871462 [Pholiota conissans]|uniref:Uncharacterized protein n=1 Tax=Pholiota conissans TaxID=109636 RepID=A0A9P6D707_9AGAR|nr:hypothetical protein BDN70DRAFT_871462 [Pholiota conissans]
MSRSRSTSLEIVPPTNSRARGLGEVADAILKEANKAAADSGKDSGDADAEADEIDEEVLPPKAATASVSTMPNAPVPCERCVRTGKACKGLAGSRCEYCKRLKQKCSNSTGPARGKQSASAKKHATADSAGPIKSASGKASISEAANLKRKPSSKVSDLNGDADGHSIDGEGSIDYEDGHEPPPRLNKKRRISKGSSGPTRIQLIKAVGDMESSIKRIQTSVSKEVDKMNGIIRALNTKIKEMDEE